MTDNRVSSVLQRFKSAMRAARDGWVNGDPFCRRVGAIAITMLTVYFAAMFVVLPTMRVSAVTGWAVGVAMQLWLIAVMPRSRP